MSGEQGRPVRAKTAAPLESVERAEREARRIVERTTWSMALEDQRPDDDVIERIVETVTLELLKDEEWAARAPDAPGEPPPP